MDGGLTLARWKLMTSHYINTVEQFEWEYSEVDRATGRQKRVKVPVPRFLDIRDPGDWTNRWPAGTNMSTSHLNNEEGEIIVCLEGKGELRDIAFIGDPTPDMYPIDDEAKAISASFEGHWRYKPEGAEINYSQSMVDQFKSEMAESEAKSSVIEIAGLADLVAAMAVQTKAVTDLVANQQHTSTRRV
jgi:hypothetical protein